MRSQQETPASHTPTFNNLYDRARGLRIAFPEFCEINPKYGNSSGVFGGGHHHEITQNMLILNPFENYAIRVIQSLILQSTRPVRVLDEGGMIGESMVIIGRLLRHEISDGRLELYVSNREEQYTPENLITEARRRLEFLTVYQGIQAMKREGDENQDFLGALESRIKPIVDTKEEIDFIQKWSDLVTFTSGVDVCHLADAYTWIMADGGFEFIHDHYGGLVHSNTPRQAFRAAVMAIDQKQGTLMSNASHTMLLHSKSGPPSLLLQQSSLTGIAESSYVVYSFPKSPARDIMMKNEMLTCEL